ncbi:MAG: hypothetical protein HFG60_13015 [Lachnospiraceae bacterium]|nr:hypothetical protein [Lachnospiraceae bacterium]
MSKQKRACLLLAMAGVIVSACSQAGGSGRWAADVDSIYVTKSLDVRSAMVFTSAVANDLYDQEELAQDTREWVQDYNAKEGREESLRQGKSPDPDKGRDGGRGKGKLPVALTSCTLKGGTGAMVFDYGTPEDFVKFSQEVGDTSHTVTALSVGTVADMLPDGKVAGLRFAAPDGKAAEGREVAKHPKYRVVAIEGAATVCTEGKVAYVSFGDMAVKDDYTVVTGEGLHYIIFH